MSEPLLLAAALAASFAGMAWLALAMDGHWQQATGAGKPIEPQVATALRLLGATALLASLLVCLAADHPSMAVLVWVMSLAGAALAVALVLAWRPRWLARLVARSGRRAED